MNSNRQTNRQYVIRKRSWIQRYPKIFFWTTASTCLLIFFSRPLYDAFNQTDFVSMPLKKSQQGILENGISEQSQKQIETVSNLIRKVQFRSTSLCKLYIKERLCSFKQLFRRLYKIQKLYYKNSCSNENKNINFKARFKYQL